MKSISYFLVATAALFLMITNHLDAQDIFGSVETKMSKYKEAAAKERVLVLMDRDIYEPGDFVWLDVTIFDIFKPAISSLSSEVVVDLVNHKGDKVLNKKIVKLDIFNFL